MLEHLPVAAYTCDPRGFINSYNKAAAELWGREPVPGKDRWCGSLRMSDPEGKLIPPEHAPMALAFTNKNPIQGQEIIILRPDGGERNVLAYPVPFFDSSGQVSGGMNTLIDITQQRMSEERQAMQAAIIESSDDAIISKTLGGIITSWNPGAEQILGYTEKEVLGKHITLIIPPDRQDEEALIIGKISRGEKIDHYETIRLTKHGKQIPISLTISPIKDSQGRIIGASKIARHIGQQKEDEESLRQLYEEVKVLNAKKDEFIGIASHELKTPLTSIKGYLQLLERSLTDASDRDFLQRTLRQLNNLSGLVSDLLDVSKIQSGKLQLSMEHFDFHALLAETMDIMQQSYPSHRLQFHGERKPLFVRADRHRMEQVLNNLIVNAIKYSPGEERVDITLSFSDEEVVVSIRDYGMGIPLTSQDKIFSRFFRVEGLDPHLSGLGLGLYISREIIDRHQGKIGVTSEPGMGSTFQFSIPVNL